MTDGPARPREPRPPRRPRALLPAARASIRSPGASRRSRRRRRSTTGTRASTRSATARTPSAATSTHISWDIGPTLAAGSPRRRPGDPAAVRRRGSRRRRQRDGPGRSTTRSCRWPSPPTGERRSAGASATSRSASAAGRRRCGCPRRAVDLPTLRLLAEPASRHTILAPWQADDERVDARRPYRVDLGGGRHDRRRVLRRRPVRGRLVRARARPPTRTAFARERFAAAPGRGARRTASRRRWSSRPTASCTATTSRSATCSSSASSPPRPRRRTAGFDVVTLAAARRASRAGGPHPAMRIRERTSWSCHHGVLRWSAECPDAPDGRWKGPLRAALDRLAGGIDAATEPPGAAAAAGRPTLGGARRLRRRRSSAREAPRRSRRRWLASGGDGRRTGGCSSTCSRRSAGGSRCSPATAGSGTTRRDRRPARSCAAAAARPVADRGRPRRDGVASRRLVADLAVLRSPDRRRSTMSTAPRSTATRSSEVGPAAAGPSGACEDQDGDHGGLAGRHPPPPIGRRAAGVLERPRASTSSAARTCRSPPRSTGSSPTRSSPGRLQPGTRLPPVRELGAALRVNPNTVRAVYRRLADAGYVVGRHGAGTRVVDRPPLRRGSDALAGIVAETLRRAAQLGFTRRRGRPGHVHRGDRAQAPRAARPGPVRRVHERRRAFDAERIIEAFPDRIEAMGVLLDELPDRLERYHYDLVATTTFHADEAQAYVGGLVPVVAMLVGPGYMSTRPRGRRAAARLEGGPRVRLRSAGSRTSPRCSSSRARPGSRSCRPSRTPRRSSTSSTATADMVLLSREAMALGLDSRFERPERLRRVELRVRPRGPRAPPPGDRARRRVPRGRRPPDGSRPPAPVARVGGGATLYRCEPCPSRERRAERFGLDAARVPGRRSPAPAPRDLAADIVAARRVAAAVNATRRAGEPSAQAGELAALELLHEIFHLLVVKAAELVPPAAMDASTDASRRPSASPWSTTCSTRSARVPRRRRPPGARPARGAAAGPDRQREPGARPLRDLVDDSPLAAGAARRDDRRARGLRRRPDADRAQRRDAGRAAARAGPRPPDVARRPAALRPRPLARLLGADSTRCSTACSSTLDVIAEEERGLHLRFGGGGDGGAPAAAARRRTCRGARRRARALLERLRVDAAPRADRQEHLRLARPALAARTSATSGRSTRSPTRSSTGSPAGASPACG